MGEVPARTGLGGGSPGATGSGGCSGNRVADPRTRLRNLKTSTARTA